MKSSKGFCLKTALSLSLLLLANVGFVRAAATSDYPSRPIRLVIGFPPGGSTDTIARIVAPRLHDVLGRSWVVDNRGGAAGNIATEIVARATPDGYTILLVTGTSITASPLLYKLAVDVERDLRPVVMMATAQYLLVVNASLKATNVNELVELARAQSGRMNYASVGIGTPQHLAAELFKMRAGIEIAHVPYKGGGPAAAALLGNEVPVMFGSMPPLLEHVRTGRLRALAVTGLTRAAVAPTIPTLDESGFRGFEITSWYGLLAPAHTPSSIIDMIYGASLKVLETPRVREAIQREGLEITIKDPKDLAQHIKAERAVIAKVIKAASIRLD